MVIVIFVAQLALCFKTKKLSVKLIPIYFVILMIGLVIATVEIGSPSESLMDLSGLVAMVILCAALIFGVAIGAAWLIYKLYKKQRVMQRREHK